MHTLDKLSSKLPSDRRVWFILRILISSCSGANPRNARWVYSRVLYIRRNSTGSQCKSARIEVIWAFFLFFVTSQAAVTPPQGMEKKLAHLHKPEITINDFVNDYYLSIWLHDGISRRVKINSQIYKAQIWYINFIWISDRCFPL